MTSIRWRHGLILIFLGLAAYGPTLFKGFVFDDHLIIEQNPYLRSWSPAALRHDFSANLFNGQGDPFYRPLVTLMDRIDFSLWGLHPWGYHATNLLFHIGCALLFYQLVLVLGFSSPAALLTACAFVVHPIGIDLMIHIAARGEQMGLFFSLLTLLFLLKESPRAQIAGLFSYVLAVFSKESSVITPGLLALVLFFIQAPPSRYRSLIPLSILTGLYVWLHGHLMGPVLSAAQQTLIPRFFLMVFPKIIWGYAGLILAPWNLHFMRMIRHISPVWFLYGTALLLLFGGILKMQSRLGLFCAGWFILTLLPKTPIMISLGSVMDHWGYGASFAILLPIGLFVSRYGTPAGQTASLLVKIIFYMLIVMESFLAQFYTHVQGTDEQVYRWTLRFENVEMPRFNLGLILLQSGRASEALPDLQTLYSAHPDHIDYGHALALAYWKTGQRERAVTLLEQLVASHPTDRPTAQSLRESKKELRAGEDK